MIGNMYKFYTNDTGFSVYNGHTVKVIDELEPPTVDREVGQMFNVESMNDGSKWHVYADELKPL